MKNLLIFAISSDLPQEGKSTAAKAIIDGLFSELGLFLLTASKRKILSFADALKKEVCKIYGLDEYKMFNDEQYKCKNRLPLINHGQSERAKDKDVWVKKLCEEVDKIIGSDFITVIPIPDLRFKNELDYLISKYGEESVVHIHITASHLVMMKRKGWMPDSQEFIDWLGLMDDTSEKDFIVGRTICTDLVEDVCPKYIVSNNSSKECFEDQIETIARNEVAKMHKNLENKNGSV